MQGNYRRLAGSFLSLKQRAPITAGKIPSLNIYSHFQLFGGLSTVWIQVQGYSRRLYIKCKQQSYN